MRWTVILYDQLDIQKYLHQAQCPSIKLMYHSKDDHQPAQAARTQGIIARINTHSNRLMMPPPLGRGIKRWCTSDVCLSITYIGPKPRTERPRKTEIGTEVAGITCDSDTTFKVKRSKINLHGAGAYRGPPAQLVTIELYIIVNGIRAYKSHIFNICIIADTVWANNNMASANIRQPKYTPNR